MLDSTDDLAVLALAVVIDLALGEAPARFHPTVWMGRSVDFAQKLAPRTGPGALMAGLAIAIVLPAFWAAGAFFAAKLLHDAHQVAYIIVGAILLKSTFALKMLHEAAAEVRQPLADGDVEQARLGLRSLVSRDPSALTPEQTAAATVESVSENIADSIGGPWLFFALFGLPGAFAYRAINTLDSMIGYHGEYELLGKASARLDDLINLVPARMSGLYLVLASALLPGQRVAGAWRIMWRHHNRTESPNAGWTMSGMAGALGVELEKVGHYRLGENTRPVAVEDITQAIRSMYVVAVFALATALALVYGRSLLF
ncbi:MAG: cobalamin biosynthesis protein CobD [SAR202 cluster bacterium Io17-Chloro-G7]|nr:MAG: cobalamin biosynthesis protein CobD [SAR202 cluster bacterium Io17-Chloro-G7]